ncbi:cytochrome P450 [Prosthecodimorpha staleyi]|uniref:Cytochrome P450 n=1 Tax=Prosthecodimorpha staleyi TaxID=2840188 RepID=A0A947D9H0_9HYPH|nr:cytochrome P450 [Prosthecodimorpha staleyi]MBT9290572.1 cytochrome P450 [Prosthecodimorpha staleyi]
MTARFARSPRDPEFFRDPYPAYRAMRDLGDLFVWEDYGFACSARHAVVGAALRDRRFGRDVLHLASREDLGWPDPPPALAPFLAFERGSMLEREPPAHTRLRGLVNRAFTARAVEGLRPAIARLAESLAEGIAREGQADLIADFAAPIPVAVICGLLGVPVEDGSQLVAWSHDMVAIYQFGADPAVEAACVAATLAFQDYARTAIAARRVRPRDDLLSALVAARDGADRLTEDELVTTVILLLNAGHEATVHAIGNALAAILSAGLDASERGAAGADPSALFADADATGRTVEECLRFDPPLHLFTRYALEDFVFCGRSFVRGEKIGLLLAAAGRDPERFAAPDRFDPTRVPGPHLAFGAGIHFCVGAPLARLELAVALPILFGRLPGLRLAAPPVWRDSYHFRGLQRLDAVWSGGRTG